MKKNYTVEILRFIFAIFILLYHYFSYFLRDTASPSLFYHAYMGDEFFFMVSGFFLGNSVYKRLNNAYTQVNYVKSDYLLARIKSIAFPYYISWCLSFLGLHLNSKVTELFQDLTNSVFELTFLDMAGFKMGYYANSVAWYLSALFICILIFAPIVEHYRNSYLLKAAPIISIFIYGILALHTDFLFAPHTIMFGWLYKGMLSSIAGVNAGLFLYGLYRNDNFVNLINRNQIIITLTQIISFCFIIFYLIVPTSMDYSRDYICVLCIFILLISILCTDSFLERKLQKIPCVLKLGRASVYIYFSQAIIYTQKKRIHDWNISNYYKLLIFLLLCFLAATIVYLIERIIKKVFGLRKKTVKK